VKFRLFPNIGNGARGYEVVRVVPTHHHPPDRRGSDAKRGDRTYLGFRRSQSHLALCSAVAMFRGRARACYALSRDVTGAEFFACWRWVGCAACS
jgi:hypothetical protein